MQEKIKSSTIVCDRVYRIAYDSASAIYLPYMKFVSSLSKLKNFVSCHKGYFQLVKEVKL